MNDQPIIIGITSALAAPSETGYIQQQVGAPYVRALEEAGATPVVLPVTSNVQTIRRLLELVDGVLFPGGGDINPALYGQERLPEVQRFDEASDRFEIELCRQAVQRDLPVLAICRGIQVLNVALGGTLIQDLPTQRQESLVHRQKESRSQATHVVQVCPGSKLASVLGATELNVNTFHHQALDHLGQGLQVTARANDEIIEGVEAPDRDFVVGVQFHPEETIDTVPATRNLFISLVEAARAKRSEKGEG